MRPRGFNDIGKHRELAGLEEHCGSRHGEAEHVDERQRVRGGNWDQDNEARAHHVSDDHHRALVEAIDEDAGERAKEDVGQRVEGKDHACAERGPSALVHEPREGDHGEPVAHLRYELACPEKQEVAVAGQCSRRRISGELLYANRYPPGQSLLVVEAA